MSDLPAAIAATHSPRKDDRMTNPSENRPDTGRGYAADVFGQDPKSMEQKALSEAKDFLGDDVQLWLDPTYVAHDASGVGYRATIFVYEVVEAAR
ncbi:hypothetical protein [Nonomuraea sp. NPDC050202]|jgi:hypothetical protein|uniref:hypothetical protein n=1 Tax=Nonomuraea sp. NPDC050202 TaxID=3155035 RepID=UPI0033FE5C54